MRTRQKKKRRGADSLFFLIFLWGLGGVGKKGGEGISFFHFGGEEGELFLGG